MKNKIPIRIQKKIKKELDDEYRNYFLTHHIIMFKTNDYRTPTTKIKTALMITNIITVFFAYKIGYMIGIGF